MNKLDALKDLMKQEGVDAYLIPHTDEFQSEYTAPYAERLRFITGFTGSAGFAIVRQENAAFFTDGRYIIQAQDEVDSSQFEQFHLGKNKPEDWLKDNSKGSVGYDPWLFTPNQLKRFKDKGLELKSIEGNLIDRIWCEDQPSRPNDKAFVHPLEFAGEPHFDKCKRIGENLKADKTLITNPDSIAWLLNIRGDDIVYTPVVLGYVLLDKDGTYDFFVSLDKINAKLYAHLSTKGRIIDVNQIDRYLSKITPSGIKSIQLDPGSAPSALVDLLEDTGLEIVHQPDPCQLPKAIKNQAEIQGMHQAHIRDGVALIKFMAWLDQQPLTGETTEWTAGLKLHALRSEGEHFYDLSFDTISGYGPHGAVIHYRVTPESSLPIGRDSLYLVDSGGQYFDGTTDVTRTFCLGKPTAEHKDRYTRVLKGHIALARAHFPKGTRGFQLDTFARHALWEGGLDYDHGTGHGVGSFLGVHEGPIGISKLPNSTPLEPGMILSNEPGFYKEGDYGIRIESLMVVKEAAAHSDSDKPFYEFETITMVPLERKLINVETLSSDEIKWLNGYHETVKKTVGPLLDGECMKWLEASTTPLVFS